MSDLFGIPIRVDEEQVSEVLVEWSDGTTRAIYERPVVTDQLFTILGFQFNVRTPTPVVFWVSEDFREVLRERFGK